MKIDIDVEYYEYECGCACSPVGCVGHETDIPVAIILNGTRFFVDGYEAGDWPGSFTDEEVEGVKRDVKELVDKLRKE